MKELTEFHFLYFNYHINFKSFLCALRALLNLRPTELHRIKVGAMMNNSDGTHPIKSFYILFNNNSYSNQLKQAGNYLGQWRWEIVIAQFTAIVLFPPRGNSGFVINTLHHDEPRKEVAIKNSSNWSLFDALAVISTHLPVSLSAIESLSLANEIIFVQFKTTRDAEYFLINFECDAIITYAHSRGHVVTVDNYPVYPESSRKRCILDRIQDFI